MFWFFGAKKEVEKVKEDTKKAFDGVKKDVEGVGKWIKHLDNVDSEIKQQVLDLKNDLSMIKDEIEQFKDIVSMSQQIGVWSKKQVLAKQRQTAVGKQTDVYGVDKGVQTAVQTAVFNSLDDFLPSERELVRILVMSELKLSYDDLSAMTGKERSTIRGQINLIKQKSEGLIQEIIEKNGKKRVFVSPEIKDLMLKSMKVRIKKQQKNE